MARATKSNNWGNAAGFLSDIVGGSVVVDNPDGVLIGDGLGPYSTDLRQKRYGLQESGIYGVPSTAPGVKDSK